jgi:hypothetical protein
VKLWVSFAVCIKTYDAGSLYFANVLKSDHANGNQYTCTVNNERLRLFVHGADQFVDPIRAAGSVRRS